MWERLRALVDAYGLDARQEVFEALFDGWEKPRPLFTMDSSYTPGVALTWLLATPTIPPRGGLRMPRSRHAPLLLAISCPGGSRVDRGKTTMEDQTAPDRSVDIAPRGCKAMSGNC